jgi:hypothetical protein
VGFVIEGLAVRYSHATYTGTLIDLSAIANIPAYGVTIRDCLIGGASSSAVNSGLLVNCRQGVEFHFTDCAFERAVIGVYGRDAGSWSNAFQFTSCHFAALGTDIYNPYAQWLFTGCTFEPATMAQTGVTTTNGYGAIFAQDAAPIQSVTFIGCGFWDGTSGTWINVAGRGLSLYGCYWEPQGGSARTL